MINGVCLTPLSIIPTPGGDVLHALKRSDFGFIDFGEAYFSEIGFNKIKAWKRHKRMTLNLVVPIGKINFVLCDDRLGHSDIKVEKIILSRDNYFRLTVPPMIWVGFQGIDTDSSLLLNVADIPHDLDEVDKAELNKFKFDWSI